MTVQKHLKQRVRARMQKTGESYASARRHVVHDAAPSPVDPSCRWHFPGSIPATTALRVLLAHAGIRAPHTNEPYSEAMLFGVAGGIGIGVFSFFYEKENFASFYVSGRHLGFDDEIYFRQALVRLGCAPVVKESSGAKAAQNHLAEALESGPCIAWVDMVHLPHRGLPQKWSGGGYHVITVYRLLDNTTALIGDLTDEPIKIAVSDLAEARARIKKFKNRLLSVPEGTTKRLLNDLVKDGLRSCHEALLGSGPKNFRSNFSLEAIRVWAERIHGSKDKESWDRVFKRGPNLWRGLVSIYEFIEHYGTGGGLCRPMFSEFLVEGAAALKNPALHALSEQYAQLGRDWSELADAALPTDIAMFREVKESAAVKAECIHASDDMSATRAAWKIMAEIETKAGNDFPLSEAACVDLRAQLQKKIRSIYESEKKAHAALGEFVNR